MTADLDLATASVGDVLDEVSRLCALDVVEGVIDETDIFERVAALIDDWRKAVVLDPLHVHNLSALLRRCGLANRVIREILDPHDRRGDVLADRVLDDPWVSLVLDDRDLDDLDYPHIDQAADRDLDLDLDESGAEVV